MKRLLLAPLILGLTAPVQARPPGLKPDLKVGQCTETTVKKLFTRWPKDFYSDGVIEKYGVGWEDQTGIINFSNDLTVYLYRNLKATNSKWNPLTISGSLDFKDAKNLYLNGDKIKVCLKFIPTECRKTVPDIRGEIYSITNQRTRKTHYGHFGRNQCGGA
tara:strand:+ start:767 stop:1249 length:483 start_codon:yes stop_codon:yes gene_type:complete